MIDEWGMFAKRIKEGAENRAKSQGEPGEGADVEMKDCVNELRQEEFEYSGIGEEEFYDAISGEVLESELVREGRRVEMETFKKHGVYVKRPVGERLEMTGKKPIGVSG